MKPEQFLHQASIACDVPPQDVERQIDCICDRFEAELREGRPCDFDVLLNGVTVEHRDWLLRELLLIAVDYAQRARKLPTTTSQPASESDSTRRLYPTKSVAVVAELLDDRKDDLQHGPKVATTFGEFDLIEELGRGGMGVVYRAFQARLGRTVAIKIISPHRLSESDVPRRDEAIRRFRREVQAAARLEHDNIVAVYDVGTVGAIPYYVMRYVEGKSLAEITKDGPLEPHRAVRYITHVTRAVSLLHQAGVLHRDLKPSNILVEASTDRALVTDFGLAKLIDAPLELTMTGEVFGSPPYMAPEQIRDSNSVRHAADLYSLGATLYQLLVGRPPFQAATLAETVGQVLKGNPVSPRQLNPAISRDLETICLKCLEMDPPHRYASAQHLADDLHRYAAGRPILARPLSAGGRVWRLAGRHRAISSMMATCVLLLVCVAIGSLALYRSELRSVQVTENALLESKARLAQELLIRSDFISARDPIRSLPWLVESLHLTQGTYQEASDRLRIGSILDYAPQASLAWFHNDRVNRAQFGPKAGQAFSAASDGVVHIWSLADGKCLRTISHDSPLSDAKASPDGNVIATVGGNCVRIWNPATGEEVRPPLVHPAVVVQAEFTADGHWLITRGKDEHIRRWDVRTGQLELPLMSHDRGPIYRMEVLHRSGLIISTGGDLLIRTWELRSANAASPAFKPESEVSALAASKDGKYQAIGCQDGHVYVKTVASGELVLEGEHGSQVKQLRFSKNAKFMAVATAKSITIWNMTTRQRVANPLEQPNVVCMAFSSDALFVTGTTSGNAQVWDLASGVARSLPMPHAKAVTDVAFSPSGHQVLTASEDWGVRLWKWKPSVSGEQIGHIAAITAVKSTLNAQTLLSYGPDHSARLFRASDAKQHSKPLRLNCGVIDASISADGQLVATVGSDRSAILWEVMSGQQRIASFAHEAGITKVAVAPDGNHVITGDKSGILKIWNSSSGDFLKQIDVAGTVTALEFSRSGHRVAVGAGRHFYLLEGAPDFELDCKPIELGALVRGIRWSPSGECVISCTSTGIAQLWDSRTGFPEGCPMQNTSEPLHAEFSPSGHELLVTCRDGNCRIWSTEKGLPRGPSFSHTGPVTFGCFSEDARFVATCGQDHISRIWDSATGKPITMGFLHEASPIYAQFVEGRRLLVITERGQVQFIDFKENANSIADLVQISKERSYLRVDGALGATLLAPTEIKAIHEVSSHPNQLD